jgi:hypothetical protein
MDDPTPAPARSAPTESPLFVHESGAGTPLLLIHGLLASGWMFDPVLPT